jgi:hypothetical protein
MRKFKIYISKFFNYDTWLCARKPILPGCNQFDVAFFDGFVRVKVPVILLFNYTLKCNDFCCTRTMQRVKLRDSGKEQTLSLSTEYLMHLKEFF